MGTNSVEGDTESMRTESMRTESAESAESAGEEDARMKDALPAELPSKIDNTWLTTD